MILYVIFAVITIILFILTRLVNIRIIKCDSITICIGFTIFEFKYTKKKNNSHTVIPKDSVESKINPSISDIISLLSMLLRYLQKCRITIRKLVIPKKENINTINSYFRFWAAISAIIAYIDSQVEKLDIKDNAFILSSDKSLAFDLSFSIMLLDTIILVFRLLYHIIRMGKMEKANVGI